MKYLRGILIPILIAVTLMGCGIEQTNHMITIEAGSELSLNAEDFFDISEKEAENVSFDLSGVDTTTPGSYMVTATYGNKHYPIIVKVEGSTPSYIESIELKQRYVITQNAAVFDPGQLIQNIQDIDGYTLSLIRFERMDDLSLLENTTPAELAASFSFTEDQDALARLGNEGIPSESGIYRAVLSIKDRQGNVQLEEICFILDTEEALNEDMEYTGQNPTTVKGMLSAALEPVGNCLYVWGGGWNEEDNAAGVEAMTLGVSSGWNEFFKENDSSYDFRNTRYQIHDGLDCSGYVGYVTYQIFEDEYSDSGYVFQSGDIPSKYQDLFGGEYHRSGRVTDYQPCDIMGKNGHVVIVIGQCEDGSILFMHASPPALSLSGTPAPRGGGESEAVALAKQYMSKYRPECYERYDTCTGDTGFPSSYSQFRWDPSVLSDPDGYRDMTVEEILADLFGE